MVSDFEYKHTYQAFGLTISSEIACNELLEGKGVADVTILFDKTELAYKNELHQHTHTIEKDGTFIFHLAKIATYYIIEGKQILIAKAPNTTEDLVRIYLLGSVFAILLNQRKLLTFHAAAIATSKGAVLFTGDSGVGKSSLIANLYKKGYQILSDDLCAIDTSNDQNILIYGSYPRLKLNEDIAQKLVPQLVLGKAPDPTIDKHILNIRNQFVNQPIPLYKIYELNRHSLSEVKLSPLSASKALEMIYRNIFRLNFIQSFRSKGELFQQISSILAVKSVEVLRPSDSFTMNQLTEELEKDFL